MPQVDSHVPGAFCWIELATSDQPAAKAFYTALFNWQYRDNPMGPEAIYTMFTLQDRNAAGCYTLQPDEAKLGIPPHWNLYVSVASADATAALAATNNARAFCPPIDVATHGRMATMADPTGAVFSIWEPKTHTGVGIQREHATFCWADLSTPDPTRAAEFYAAVLGWSTEPSDGGYLHILNQNDYIGGIPPAANRGPHQPPHWLIYFQVDDCEAATTQAIQLGAKVYAGPMSIEHVGRMTVLADPQGAIFSLFQPAPPQ